MGYGVNGATEEVSEDEFEAMFQTNLYGVIRTTRAFLPHFRQRRKGHAVNLRSRILWVSPGLVELALEIGQRRIDMLHGHLGIGVAE
jgi:NAD(P)-dependent dehydrogenase (short-subunit alcohol dehydrogenase family)